MKRAGLGHATPADELVLVRLGFGRREADLFTTGTPFKFVVADEGRAFDDAANVYGDDGEARRLFRDGYMRMPVTQALMQGLHGRGAAPVAGAFYFLTRHGLTNTVDLRKFRRMLTVLNSLGIASYSAKHQTVRIITPLPDAVDAESVVDVRVVEPERPFSNMKHLREVLRQCKDYIWWADPHFERRGFDPLVDEADASKIKEIRILTSARPAAADLKDFGLLEAELEALGIGVAFRYVPPPDRDWHDRFIVGRNVAWNVPPLGAVSKGSYSEFKRTEQRPPFETWWAKGTPVGDL